MSKNDIPYYPIYFCNNTLKEFRHQIEDMKHNKNSWSLEDMHLFNRCKKDLNENDMVKLTSIMDHLYCDIDRSYISNYIYRAYIANEWSKQKQVYSFDIDGWKKFKKSYIHKDFVLSKDIVSMLPFKSFLIEFDQKTNPIYGFIKVEENYIILCISIRISGNKHYRDTIHFIPIYDINDSEPEFLEDSIDKYNFNSWIEDKQTPAQLYGFRHQRDTFGKLYLSCLKNIYESYHYNARNFIIAALLYLCVDNSIINENKKYIDKKSKNNRKASKTKKWGVEVRESILKQNNTIYRYTTNEKTDIKLREHIRRGHMHTYCVGKGRKEKIQKWVEPTIVNKGTEEDELPVVIRKEK